MDAFTSSEQLRAMLAAIDLTTSDPDLLHNLQCLAIEVQDKIRILKLMEEADPDTTA